jgi:hypothetical protein
MGVAECMHYAFATPQRPAQPQYPSENLSVLSGGLKEDFRYKERVGVL